jgi:hypothetical protein
VEASGDFSAVFSGIHALAILFPGASGQGDDGQVAPRHPFSLAHGLSDLEAVQFRHVDVQQQRT